MTVTEMRLEYIHERGEDYMRITDEDVQEESILFEMLWHNKIMGFLPVNISGIDEKKIYSYLISGLKNLADYLKECDLDEDRIKILLRSLCQTIVSGREYFIEDYEILLLPECIYVNHSGQVQLAVFPYANKQEKISLKISDILETFMKYLNHADKRQVFYIYELYRYCHEENFSIRYFAECCEKKKENIIEEVREEESFYSNENLPKEESLVPNSNSTSLFNMFREKVESFFQKEMKQKKEIMFVESQEERNLWLFPEKKGERIFISKFPFIIGSLETSVDGLITHPGVSRVHGKFDWDGIQVIYTDLNSKNGTYVNDIRVVPYETQMIKKGDWFRFGIAKYKIDSIKCEVL